MAALSYVKILQHQAASMLLYELPPWPNLVSHQQRKDAASFNCIMNGEPPQSASVWIHCGGPKLLWHHLAQTLHAHQLSVVGTPCCIHRVKLRHSINMTSRDTVTQQRNSIAVVRPLSYILAADLATLHNTLCCNVK